MLQYLFTKNKISLYSTFSVAKSTTQLKNAISNVFELIHKRLATHKKTRVLRSSAFSTASLTFFEKISRGF